MDRTDPDAAASSSGASAPAAPRSVASCLIHAAILGALSFLAARGPIDAWAWSREVAARGVHAEAAVIELFQKTLVRETGTDSGYEYEKPYVRLQYADPADGDRLHTLERPAEGREVGERVAITVAPDGTVLVEPFGTGPLALFLSRSPALIDVARLVAAAVFAVVALLNLVALKDANRATSA